MKSDDLKNNLYFAHSGTGASDPLALLDVAFNVLIIRGPNPVQSKTCLHALPLHLLFLHVCQISAADWGQAETSYNLYEVLFKVHKVCTAPEGCFYFNVIVL